MKLSTLIRRLDIFGVPITFIGFNRLKYQTKLGGIISIILIGWLSYNIILQFVKMISRNTAVVQTLSKFNDIPQLVQLSNDNFMFAVQVDQPDYIKVFLTNLIKFKKPYFTFKLEAVTVTDKIDKSSIQIPLAPCTIQDWQQLYFYNDQMKDTLIVNGFEDWVCPQYDGKTFNLQGRYGASIFDYLKITAKVCEQGDYEFEYTCPSQQEISDFVVSLGYEMKINVMVSNLYLNTDSSNSYTGYIDRDIYLLLNPFKQLGQIDLFLRNWDVFTNPSIISDTPSEHNSYLVLEPSDIQDRYAFRELSNQKDIAKLYIRNSQYMFDTERHYVSIGDFLAYVGGLFGSLYTMAYAVMSLYAYEQLWLKLFKTHYTLLLEDKVCKNLNEIIDEKFSIKNIFIPNLKSFLCFFKTHGIQNIVTFFESQSIIQEDLSIVSYLKVLKDLQKIKKVLFNDQQQDILDSYNKDTVILSTYKKQHSHKLEKGKKYLYGHQFQEHTLKQYNKILELFEQLMLQKDQFKLQISKQIVNVFDKDLQYLLLKEDYRQLKYQRNTTVIELPIITQQYSISRDITRLINYEKKYQLDLYQVESLIKSIFFKKQTIYLQNDINIHYECEKNNNQITYIITINNRFQEYNLQVKPKNFVEYLILQNRKHVFKCQLQPFNFSNLDTLIDSSIELTLNEQTLYLNCSLTQLVQPTEIVSRVPKDFRTQLIIFLEECNQERYQVLNYLFHHQKYIVNIDQSPEIIFLFNQGVTQQQSIEIIMNWPDSQYQLDQMVVKNHRLIQFLQILYDLFTTYLQ